MKIINNQEDALSLIAEVQAVILKKAKVPTGFRFEFTINPETGDVNLGGRNKFFLADKKTSEALIFAGSSLEEAVRNFCEFFNDGGTATINQDENNSQFRATFNYQDYWRARKVYVGYYDNRE